MSDLTLTGFQIVMKNAFAFAYLMFCKKQQLYKVKSTKIGWFLWDFCSHYYDPFFSFAEYIATSILGQKHYTQ